MPGALGNVVCIGHFRFRNAFENFGLKGCIPDTCSGADLSCVCRTNDILTESRFQDETIAWPMHRE